MRSGDAIKGFLWSQTLVMNRHTKSSFIGLIFGILLLYAPVAESATLTVSPNTGVYTVGKQFTVSVILNTEGKSVNAADAQVSFNSRELQVLSISRSGSIFNLWTEEPTFSNSTGLISFGGGSPNGYKGSSGNILQITFKPIGAGTPGITFKSGSVLAADGLGTNVLTAMNGGVYTAIAPSENPEPEYVAPANTPKQPIVLSETHPNQDSWYREKTAKLTWELPGEVTGVRMLLDREPNTIPTIVYSERIAEKTIEDLEEGVSYFHIQFKNNEGWGKITHYRIAVDTEAPTDFSISEATGTEPNEVSQMLVFSFTDISPVSEYKIQIDGQDPFVYADDTFTRKYPLEILPPGYHTIIVEVFDSAGNTTASTYSFTVEAFEKPEFIEYPSRINTEVIPAIKGKTRPHAHVAVSVSRAGGSPLLDTAEGARDPYSIVADENGEFTYIPDNSFERGVYVITAIAKDVTGRLSDRSDEIKIIVESPGYIVLGTMVINALSVIVPLCALLLLFIFGTWYLWHRLIRWRKQVRKETLEAEDTLAIEFNSIIVNLHEKVATLKEARKGKLTKTESDLIDQIENDLKQAQSRIGKEIEDIEDSIV